MILDRVTITGADDSIHPQHLLDLSKSYPFVEWAILVSQSSEGHPRFPKSHWIKTLQNLDGIENINLSLHLCGKWVRDLLMGEITFPDWMLEKFQRVQLNFHAEKTKCDPERFLEALKVFKGKQIIFQFDDNGGNEHFKAVANSIDGAPLFDTSGGAGVLPDHWPSMEQDYCGYAGGLGPDNLEEQIQAIGKAAGTEGHIWIDMETKVRSKDNQFFDLGLVNECLKISEPFITTKS